MKKTDFIFFVVLIGLFLPFFLSEPVFQFYNAFNKEHGMITSFIKFAILATMGESLGLRIKSGVYNKTGFGLIPRAIVWGLLGLTINMAFIIFAKGAPQFLAYLGVDLGVAVPEDVLKGDMSAIKLLAAFTISATMNLIYAPIMMTLHKITDTHITNNGGTIAGLFKPIKMKEIFVNLNWDIQWSFVFKKTIPFFWIPAHTITFMLPAEYRVLFAALLGIVLGVLLSVASLKGNK